MKFKNLKSKWFNKNVLNYMVLYKHEGKWYVLVEYVKDGYYKNYATSKSSTVNLLVEYFNRLDACQSFFEAKRIHRLHAKKKKQDHLHLSYETIKSKIAKLEKLIN